MKTWMTRLVLAFAGAAWAGLCAAQPQVLYTDIVSGPNVGGEDDHGAYLTIYGRHFGVSRGHSRVFINDVEVAAYKSWTDTKLSVQPGRKVSSGAIRVEVDGASSNTDQNFTVRPGRIFFVALNGSDASGRAGDIHRPFRNAQQTFNSKEFAPGDFLVLRGGKWTDLGDYENRFLNIGRDGTPGAPMTIQAYPGETVTIAPPKGNTAFRLYRYNARVANVVISNFDIRINGDGVCIHMGYGSTDLRIVGNEAQGQLGRGGGAGCVTGSVSRTRILGNDIHDNGGDKLFHALYIDNDQNPGTCDDVEIAYNRIYNQRTQGGSGRGIQIYWEGKYRVAFTNFRIHHNIIHDIDRDGITLGNQSGPGFEVHDNLIYRTGLFSGAGIRFSGRDLEAKVFHNTIVDVARTRDVGAVWVEHANRVSFVDNIVAIDSSANYLTIDKQSGAGWLAFERNLWFGAGGAPRNDSRPITRDPAFRSPSTDDFRLGANSGAIDAALPIDEAKGSLDLAGVRRPQGAAPDLGAYEYVAGDASR